MTGHRMVVQQPVPLQARDKPNCQHQLKAFKIAWKQKLIVEGFYNAAEFMAHDCSVKRKFDVRKKETF